MDTNFKREILEGILETIKDCISNKKMEAKLAKACDDVDAVEQIAEQVAHLLILRTTIEDALAEEEEDE